MAVPRQVPAMLAKHKDFVGNVLAMVSGRSIAAGIALVTMPIVSRLYEPGDFGVAAIFLSIIGLVSTIAALRFDMAVVLPEKDEEAINLVAFALVALSVVCVVVTAGLAVASTFSPDWPYLELLGDWRWFLPAGIALMTILHVQESWLSRKKRFRTIAASLAVGGLLNSGTRIGLGAWAGSSVLGLITGNLIGMSARLFMQGAGSWKRIWFGIKRLNWAEIRRTAACYSDFPRLNAPAAIVFSLGQNLPVMLMGMMFSPAVAGFYAMADRLSQAPISIVTNSVRRVFLQKAADINNEGRSLLKAFSLSTSGLAALGLVPFLAVWFFGQPILTWLLGDKWFEAGAFIEIMAPWLYMAWITAPANPVFVTLRKQRAWLSLQSALMLLRLGAFGIAFLVGAGSETTLRFFVIAVVIGNFIILGAALLLIRRTPAASWTAGGSAARWEDQGGAQ